MAEEMDRRSSNKKGEKIENQRQKYEKIFRRVGKFKKYLHDLGTVISSHTVKVACLRDKNDEVAQCLDDFTKIEEFSTTSKLSMAVIAELVATVGDHQDLAVQRVETLVLPSLSSYSRICECIKADICNAIQAIRREKRKRKCVNTLKWKSNNDPKAKSCLNDAQRELERASAEASRFCHLSEEHVIKFEHKRLTDLKDCLGTFVKVQIASHAKSLELLTKTYKQIQNIDEDEDLEILKNSLKIGYDEGGGGDAHSKRKSSSQLLKHKKSQKSLSGHGTSTKSSASNFKSSGGSSRGRKNKESGSKVAESGGGSSSMEEISVDDDEDSSHSEVVRDLEKVLYSKHDFRKSQHNDKKKHDKKKDPRDKESQSCGRKESTRHLQNEDAHKGKDRNAEKKRLKHRRNHDDDDDPFSEEVYLPTKPLGKRPSTPPRPITVPASPNTGRRSFNEESSSRREDFTFNNKSNKAFDHHHHDKKSATISQKSNLLDSYYYSQSEEEERRISVGGKHGGGGSLKGHRPQLQAQATTSGRGHRTLHHSGVPSKETTKHVSFYNPGKSNDYNNYSLKREQGSSALGMMIGNRRDAGDFMDRGNFGAGKQSTLKNYC